MIFWLLSAMTCISVERNTDDRDTEEKDVVYRSRLECLGQSRRMTAATRNWERQGFPPTASRGSAAQLTPGHWLWTYGLQIYERINFSCFKPLSHANLLQQVQQSKTNINIYSDKFSHSHFNVAGNSDAFTRTLEKNSPWVKSPEFHI